jgi:putative methionine-R-sulfoxide reductase with GAF domain
MLYEIHMPQPGSEAPRVELVHGDNWLDALRRGLSAAGMPAPTRNLSCDLQDDESVVITDTGSGQVFRVAPVRRNAGIRARASSDVAPIIRVHTPNADRTVDFEPTDSPHDADTAGARDMADPFSEEPDDGLASGLAPMLYRQPSVAPLGGSDTLPAVPPVERFRRGTTQPFSAPTAIEQATTPVQPAPLRMDARREEALRRRREAVDREMAELEHLGRDIHDACNFALDVARAHIPCGAGSVLLIDARDRCLYFAAARGPKAAVIANRRIPLEVGIAGASIRERRPLNITDPRRDRRFASNFADTVGYHPRSLVCAPVFAGRKAFGVLELLDREQHDAFTDEDVEVLSLTARRLGAHFASLLPGGGRET